MPSIDGMLSSIGPAWPGPGFAPRSRARCQALAASFTRKAMAQTEGPCTRAKDWAKLSGSPFRMKFTSPWR